MTEQVDETPAGYVERDPRARRDALALVLIVIGVLGLIGVCFLAHPLAGAAAVCVALITVGVVLGLDL